MKFDILVFSENLSRKLKFRENLTRTTVFSLEDQYTIYIMSRSVLFKVRNISGKRCGKKKTHILCSRIFFLENRAVYDIMLENIVELGRSLVTTLGMRTACWIPKITNTNIHSEYVIVITFTPSLRYLHLVEGIIAG